MTKQFATLFSESWNASKVVKPSFVRSYPSSDEYEVVVESDSILGASEFRKLSVLMERYSSLSFYVARSYAHSGFVELVIY